MLSFPRCQIVENDELRKNEDQRCCQAVHSVLFPGRRGLDYAQEVALVASPKEYQLGFSNYLRNTYRLGVITFGIIVN